MLGSMEPLRSGHHQTIQRGKAHGRRDTATSLDRRVGAATAKMANHQSQVVRRPPEQFGGPAAAIRMAKPVEPEAADAPARRSISPG